MVPDTLPRRLRKQLDEKTTRIVCSWFDWLEYSEMIRATHPIERVKLLDWPEIDLPVRRRKAALAIGRQYPGIIFEVPTEEEDERAERRALRKRRKK